MCDRSERRHSSLDYVSPLEFEQAMKEQQTARIQNRNGKQNPAQVTLDL